MSCHTTRAYEEGINLTSIHSSVNKQKTREDSIAMKTRVFLTLTGRNFFLQNETASEKKVGKNKIKFLNSAALRKREINFQCHELHCTLQTIYLRLPLSSNNYSQSLFTTRIIKKKI